MIAKLNFSKKIEYLFSYKDKGMSPKKTYNSIEVIIETLIKKHDDAQYEIETIIL